MRGVAWLSPDQGDNRVLQLVFPFSARRSPLTHPVERQDSPLRTNARLSCGHGNAFFTRSGPWSTQGLGRWPLHRGLCLAPGSPRTHHRPHGQPRCTVPVHSLPYLLHSRRNVSWGRCVENVKDNTELVRAQREHPRVRPAQSRPLLPDRLPGSAVPRLRVSPSHGQCLELRNELLCDPDGCRACSAHTASQCVRQTQSTRGLRHGARTHAHAHTASDPQEAAGGQRVTR